MTMETVQYIEQFFEALAIVHSEVSIQLRSERSLGNLWTGLESSQDFTRWLEGVSIIFDKTALCGKAEAIAQLVHVGTSHFVDDHRQSCEGHFNAVSRSTTSEYPSVG